MHLSQGKKVKLHCESSLLAVLAEASGGMLEKSSVSVTHSMGKWERASKVMLKITYLRGKEEKLSKDRELCTKDVIPLWSVKLRKTSVIRGASINLNVITL